MIALSVSPEEEAVKAALEAGGPGITETAIAVSYLKRAVREIDPELDLKSFSVPKVLTKMGWTKVSRQIKWNGAPHWTWVRGLDPQNHHLIRVTLNASHVTSFDEDVTSSAGSVTSENRTSTDDLFT